MNNKGFVMAEVIVVAAIILVTMVGLYTSYNKIFSVYNQRIDYYDVATLYKLAEKRNDMDLNSLYSDDIMEIEDENNNNKFFLIPVSKLAEFANKDVNPKFKDYVSFLSNSLEVDTDNILVMERCLTDDNCKYAYLEVLE